MPTSRFATTTTTTALGGSSTPGPTSGGSTTTTSVRTPVTPGPASPWQLVASSAIGTGHNELRGVTVAPGVGWAVGDYFNGTSDRTLIERQSANGWVPVGSPNQPGSLHNELDAVSALSPTDAWAVGRYDPGAPQDKNLIEHWNGSSWSIVFAPNEDGNGISGQTVNHNELDGVAAVSATEVWAVGHYDQFPSISDEPLVELWNGSQWHVVPTFGLSGGTTSAGNVRAGLSAVSALPQTGEAWAVGYQIRGNVSKAFAAHWNGATWGQVPIPSVGPYHNQLNGVTALAPNDVWAVGSYFSGGSDRTLVEHWNGAAWSVVSSPNVGFAHNELKAVAAGAGGAVFAVGDYFSGSADRTLVERLNGNGWQIVPSANGSAAHNELDAVAADSSGTAIGVGTYFTGATDRPLVLRCPC